MKISAPDQCARRSHTSRKFVQAVGGNRNGDLRCLPAFDHGHNPNRDACCKPTGNNPARDQQWKAGKGFAQFRIGLAEQNKAHKQPKKRYGHSVVEQAFALNYPR